MFAEIAYTYSHLCKPVGDGALDVPLLEAFIDKRVSTLKHKTHGCKNRIRVFYVARKCTFGLNLK